MTLQFSDTAVPYSAFVHDVATKVAELLRTPEPEYISQNKAFRQFGRANVERLENPGGGDHADRSAVDPAQFLYFDP